MLHGGVQLTVLVWPGVVHEESPADCAGVGMIHTSGTTDRHVEGQIGPVQEGNT